MTAGIYTGNTEGLPATATLNTGTDWDDDSASDLALMAEVMREYEAGSWTELDAIITLSDGGVQHRVAAAKGVRGRATRTRAR